MEIGIFGLIVLVFGVLSLNLPYQWAMYGLALCSLFACAATLALPGGFGILPADLFLIFFAARAYVLGGGRPLFDPISVGRPGFWLACVCLWGCVGAIILPRLLAGTTLVFSIDRAASGVAQYGLRPLAPVSGNLSQPVYALGELALYCCMSVFVARRGGYRFFARAILALTALNVVAALLDLASHSLGVDLLAAVKTADYVTFDGAELGGLARISGTFSEASAFSSFTLPLFAFCINLWLLGYRPRLTSALAIASAGLLLMSTSATAYVGFAAYLCVLLLSRPGRIVAQSRVRKQLLWAVTACVGALGAIYAIVFLPGVVNALSDFVKATLLDKAASESGLERAALNAQALLNVVDTYGIGAGLGSVRASSFIVVVLSNLGIVGAVGFATFVVTCLRGTVSAGRAPTERVIGYAAGHGMIAVLIAASVSGSVFELGPSFYMFAAAAAGLSVTVRRRVHPASGAGRAEVYRPGVAHAHAYWMRSGRDGDPMDVDPVRESASNPASNSASASDSTSTDITVAQRRIPAWPIR